MEPVVLAFFLLLFGESPEEKFSLEGATMSVEKKPTHPMFQGNIRDIWERIDNSSIEELLEATTADPTEYRVLILRRFMELTPLSEVLKGETPMGLQIRGALLFDEYNPTFFDCALSTYGNAVWDVFALELSRVRVDNVYPRLLIKRLHSFLRYSSDRVHSLVVWLLSQSEGARLLQLLASIGLRNHWAFAIAVLESRLDGKPSLCAGLMKTSRSLMCEFKEVFPLEELFELASDKELLPELRAAAFSLLYDRKGEAASKQLLLLSISSFIKDPGNATALHAVAWRIAGVVPTEAIALIGEELSNIDAKLFQPRGEHWRRNYNECTVLRDAAIWQYFFNGPISLHTEMLKRENLSFPEALAALVRFSCKNVHTAENGLFFPAQSRAFEFVNNHEHMYDLMLMFSLHFAAGRPEWDKVAFVLRLLPAEVQETCLELAHRFNRRERDEAQPDIMQLVKFVQLCWDGENRYKKASFFRKQLVEIRDVLDMWGYYPEAVAELTALISKQGIRDNKKKKK